MNDKARLLRRREAVLTLAGLGLTGALGARASGALGTSGAEAVSGCVLSPEVTEGPYWIDNKLTRRDITEGRQGLPLELVLTVQDAKTCTANKGADVELWHCDAVGVYSGYESGSAAGAPGGQHAAPTDADRYLRGHQKAGADGRVRFLTIYPGWYRGRTPHIHLKVHVGGSVVHTGQLFFDEKTTAAVYRHAPYKTHGQPDTSHAEDMIYAQAGRSRATLKLTRRSNGRKGYRGSITLGVAT